MSTRETITIKTKDDRQKIARWALQTAEGTVVTFRKKSRSTEQSAKMWAMLGEVAAQVDWYGQKLDAEAWKDVFTASLRHARVVPGIDKGTYVPLGMHTSTMTIEEMTNLIELIYAFGAEHGVVFKDPKDPDTNSGASSPDTNDENTPPPSSLDAAGEGYPSPSPSPAATILDCAREMLTLAGLKYDDLIERDAALSQSMEEWEAKLPDEQPGTDDIAVAVKAIIHNDPAKRRTVDQAREWLASRLKTTIEELSA